MRVILLHGFTGSRDSWPAGSLDPLRTAGLEPVAVDLPGHVSLGANRLVDPVEATLEEAFARIESASGDGPIVLLGYSMGGRIALHYAVRHPERVARLILESASPGLRSGPERVRRRTEDEALAARIVERGIESFVRDWERLPLFTSQERLPEEVRGRVRKGRGSQDPAGLAAALRGLGTAALPSLWEVLRDVRPPTLALVGALDRKFVDIGLSMTARMSSARLVVAPGVGHAVHLEAPDAWAAAVLEFLPPP